MILPSSHIFLPTIFVGKKMLVVGASSGIGKACAEQLAFHGASIVATARSETKLNKLVDALPTDQGQKHVAVAGDWAGLDNAQEVAKAIAKNYKPFDGLIYAAGNEVIGSTRSMSATDISQAFDASVFGFLGLASVLASKRFWNQGGGSTVVISSIAAHRGQRGMVAYAASKSSLTGAVRSLAVELAPLNVRANIIACGAVRTEMHSRVLQKLPSSAGEAYELAHPLGVGQTADVAHTSIFLLSPGARWITGTELTLDGGYLA